MPLTTNDILKPCETTKFEFEDFVIKQVGIILNRPRKKDVCQYYLKNQCSLGNNCQFAHPSKTKLVVCKHWLRGLCKKGELCEFLHEYNLKKMPECWFYSNYGECTNPECQYLHIDPNSKVKECAWYSRGFCRHGQQCRHKHTRIAICPAYLTGFCPNGKNCTYGHPKYDLPTANQLEDEIVPISKEQQKLQQKEAQQRNMQNQGGQRSITDVTCYKCGDRGHYGNYN